MCSMLAMGKLQRLPVPASRTRRDGWTNGKRVTFFVTLAETGSVTFACVSVRLSRKSAYALRKRDSTFASLWERGLAMAGKSRRKARPPCSEGNETAATTPAATPSSRVNQHGTDRSRADAERDRFFASLKMRRSGASLRPRIEQATCQRHETVRR